MGLIGRLLNGGLQSVGQSVTQVAETFRPNATRQMELGHEAYISALEQHSSEFEHGRDGLFDRMMNGLNRLPRPFLALGTLGLFVYAMVDPAGFSDRMVGLAYVPEPLWWLLGAIVGFYFGARELHYTRSGTRGARGIFRRRKKPAKPAQSKAEDQRAARAPTADNPALQAWKDSE